MPLVEEVPWIRRNPAIAQTNIRCELNVQDHWLKPSAKPVLAVT
jgi:hypothetical protein